MDRIFVHRQKSLKYNIKIDEISSGHNLLESYKMLDGVIMLFG